MRGVHRLRRFSSEYLLPLVISALVLRALIPVGFMPGSGASFSITARMCNAVEGARSETLEIPGAPGAAVVMHCDYCVLPVLGAAAAAPAMVSPQVAFLAPPASGVDAPPSRFALQRAQIPRAPPLA
jgi:hypothetical protein